VILDHLKDYMLRAQAHWLSQIKASEDGKIKIDMSKEFLKILQKYLMHIMFGEDIDSTVIKLLTRRSSHEDFKLTEHTMSEAIEASFKQALDAIPARMPNYYFCGGKASCKPFKMERVNDQNCQAVRDTIRTYVRKRVSGERKSDVGSNSDILSAMLENTEVFDEEDVIDELMDLMVAGTQTTQNIT